MSAAAAATCRPGRAAAALAGLPRLVSEPPIEEDELELEPVELAAAMALAFAFFHGHRQGLGPSTRQSSCR